MAMISDRTSTGHKDRNRCLRRRDCSGLSIARSKNAPAAGLQMTRPGNQSTFLLRFANIPYRPPMPDTPNLRPATRDELTQSLSFTLRVNGRKRVHDAAGGDGADHRRAAGRALAAVGQEKRRFVAVLQPGAIESPVAAVQAAIVAEHKGMGHG
jgi:hypothetical protein